MDALWKDLRYSVRALAGKPGFAAVAIATLALGIGVNTALFSIVNGVLLQPLPFPQSERLVTLYEQRATFSHASISYPNYLDWQRESRCFAEMAAFRGQDFTLLTGGRGERLRGEMVSAGFFRTLGVSPLLGRDLDPAQDHLGGKPEVLISEGLWKRLYGGSHDVIGRAIRLEDTDYTITGIVPAAYRLELPNLIPADIYVPIGQWNNTTFRKRNAGLGMNAIARLKPGITLEQAQADMRSVAHALALAYPGDDSKVDATVTPLKERMVGDVRPYLLVLLAAVFFVLLIACVNVANLQLARSMSRSREFAIRLALGARKLRIMRQLLTESLLLALSGGALGLILAAWATRLTLLLLGSDLPRAGEVRLDGRVLLFTLGVSVFAGILFGMAPAIRSFGGDLQQTLRDGGRGVSGARSHVQRRFAEAQMAMAMVLLIAAGLMIRSLSVLWHVNPGFQPAHVMLFQVALPASVRHTSAEAVRAEMRRIHNEIADIPGVSNVALERGSLPMYGDSDDPFWIAGRPKPARESEMSWALLYEVEPEYFGVMKIPLKRGRLFTASDDEHSRRVVLIDEDLANRYFPDGNPIGQSIVDEFLPGPAEIVGVVGHVRHWGLDDNMALHAQFYLPLAQIPPETLTRTEEQTGVVVRTAGDPLTMLTAIRRRVTRGNSEEVVFDPHSYDELVAQSVEERSLSMILLAVFAGLALVLASIGIYGVVSYVVGQRTHEIGIRMALGAQRRNVLTAILGEGARTAAVGVAAGLAAALGLMQLMSSLLYGVSATDPLTFAAVALFLSAVAMAASLIPALRAMHVDPVITLRYE